MTHEEELQAKLTGQFGNKVTVSVDRVRRVTVRVGRQDFKSVLTWIVKELGYYHISTVTGLDSGENLEALYHLTNGEIELTIRESAPKADPHIPTATDVLPGAVLYERELQDMFGFVVDGHPDPRRYVLPEDWPDGVYPLRKDYRVPAPGSRVPGPER